MRARFRANSPKHSHIISSPQKTRPSGSGHANIYCSKQGMVAGLVMVREQSHFQLCYGGRFNSEVGTLYSLNTICWHTQHLNGNIGFITWCMVAELEVAWEHHASTSPLGCRNSRIGATMQKKQTSMFPCANEICNHKVKTAKYVPISE